jgi:hypothetical protein
MTATQTEDALRSRNSWKTVRSLLRKIRPNSLKQQRNMPRVTPGIRKGSSTTSEGSMVQSVTDFTEPRVQKALVVARKGEYEIRHDFPMPTLGDDEIMIRSHYVGLNPIDWKSVDYNFCLPQFPWVSAFLSPQAPGCQQWAEN